MFPASERFATGFNLGVNGLVEEPDSYPAQQFMDNAGKLLNVGRRKIEARLSQQSFEPVQPDSPAHSDQGSRHPLSR